jgi:uncharacterized membrane protein (UPF0136 family)
MRTAWIAFTVAAITDAATFCGISTARVAAAEQNQIARSIGGGLESALICKAILIVVAVGGCWLLRRCDAPRWLVPAVVVAVTVMGFYGAYTNVAFGWA